MHKKFGFWIPFFRTILAFLAISLLWGLVGFGFLSFEVGAAFLLWSLILGPIVISLTLQLFKRSLFRLNPLAFKKEPVLQREYLECLLKNEGLDLQIWVRPSQDLGFFWWEEGIFGKNKTHLVITTRWLQEEAGVKATDFRILWSEISKIPPRLRHLRSFQMAMWWGSSSLFDAFLLILRSVLDTFNFTDVPNPAFWMQRFSWALYSFAFGSPEEGELLPRVREGDRLAVPRSWSWFSFGVWTKYPNRYLHPTWILFANFSAFLPSEEEELGQMS